MADFLADCPALIGSSMICDPPGHEPFFLARDFIESSVTKDSPVIA
jgi:hypothetical protein